LVEKKGGKKKLREGEIKSKDRGKHLRTKSIHSKGVKFFSIYQLKKLLYLF